VGPGSAARSSSASLVAALGDRLGIRAVKTVAPRITLAIKLAWHERTRDDPAMRAFRDLVARASRGAR